MTWVRTDDAMPLHPKLLRLSDGAFRLWSNGLHFANRATTDGRIDKPLLPTLNHHGRWTPKQLAAFVSELVPSLWIDCGDHYEIHDYAHHQAEAMKDRVERHREYERDRKRKQREKDDRRRSGVPHLVPPGQTPGHPPEVRQESSVPTRPDPSRPVLSPSGESSARGRATPPSPGMDSMLRSLTPTPDATAPVAALVSETRVAAGGAPFRAVSHADRDALSRLAEWARGAPGGLADLRRVLVAFWAAKGTGARLSWLTEEDPGRWLGTAAPTKPGAFRPCPPASAFVDDDSELVAWERLDAEDKARKAAAAAGGKA